MTHPAIIKTSNYAYDKTFIPFLMLLFAQFSQGQTSKTLTEYHYISNFQVDKTLGGSLKKGNRSVSIYFKDPKPITKVTEGARVEDLPTGKLIIKYAGLDPVENDIKYFGKYDFGDTKNQSLYWISKTYLDYNCFVYVNKPTLVAGKMWKYVIMIGQMNPDNGDINLYTVYCCN